MPGSHYFECIFSNQWRLNTAGGRTVLGTVVMPVLFFQQGNTVFTVKIELELVFTNVHYAYLTAHVGPLPHCS